MAGEGAGVIVGFLFALGFHHRGRDSQRLPGIHVAGFAAVYDIGVRHVDLHNLRVPLVGLFLQAVDLGRGSGPPCDR